VELAPLPSTGWEEIDVQHADLLRRSAELKACVEGRDAQGASAVLDGFVEATLVHFATEEELMSVSQYPDQAAHKGAHDLFVHDLYALASELADSGLSAAVEEWAVVRMPCWLGFHIQTNDAPLVRHLARNKSPRLPRPATS